MKNRRIKAIKKLASKHFHVISEFKEGLDKDGNFCYKSDSLTIWDCLFYINILDNQNIKYSCFNESPLYNNWNLV